MMEMATLRGASARGSGTLRRPLRRTPVVRFLFANPLAIAGLIILVVLAVGSLIAPWIAPANPYAVDVLAKLQPPSAEHWFGTDFFGRDIFSRILYGGRNTLSIALLVVGIAFAIGVPIGLISGAAGGWVDQVLMRIVDAWLSFPSLVLAIALASILGANLRNAMIAVTITVIPQFARVARGEALRVRSMQYVEAARSTGVSTPRLIVRYIFLNCLGALVVQATLNLGSAILATASLGFLGLGAQTPTAEWGADVAANTAYLRDSPWASLAPGLAIMLTVLACNLVGDAIVDWLNPRLRKR
jgi:peptide/nickel transport system permease protein